MAMNVQLTGEDLEVAPDQVVAVLDSGGALQLIDVREPYERDAGHIADSRHVELTRLAAEADSIDRHIPVVFYCRVGSRSLMAAQALRAAGYQAYSMSGGLVRWADEGRPLSPEGGTVAEHN
jgi:hydroxyacylglutathione hydrolase/adenylyltransferase/sulfurtransferase